MTDETENKAEVLAAFSATNKTPPFWKSDPDLWFCQMEAVFARSGITNTVTKFQTVIPMLDLDVMRQVSDIVRNPSATPYEDLKARLIGCYAESESRRIQQLLEGKQLGDEKPSQLLRHMQQLAGTTVNKDILKTLWLRSLPTNTQAILTTAGHTEVEKLAEVADKIHEVIRPGEICSVAQSSSSSWQSTASRLESKIEQLTAQIAALSARGRQGQRRDSSRQSGRSQRSRSRSKGQANNPDWLCFYHFRFKEKANKCIQPCAWERLNTKSGN